MIKKNKASIVVICALVVLLGVLLLISPSKETDPGSAHPTPPPSLVATKTPEVPVINTQTDNANLIDLEELIKIMYACKVKSIDLGNSAKSIVLIDGSTYVRPKEIDADGQHRIAQAIRDLRSRCPVQVPFEVVDR